VIARPAAPDLQRDAADFHAALNELLRIYQYRDRDRICCHDVSVTQCHALELLVERGPSRSQALAEALRLDKSTTTRVVDALVRKEYVERLPDPDDARAVQLRPTRRGRALYHRINDELVAQQAALLQDLEPQLRTGATEVIRRVARAAAARFDATRPAACEPACGS
jgi:DNA-binding MarR family transcriptional regulator